MADLLELNKPGTDIAVAVAKDPGIVLLDTEKYSVWYEGLKAKGSALPTDVSSKKNRDALRSFAADVRSEKAGIKKARLRLTEEWRTMTAQANAAGKVIDEQLESLAVEIRKPLTDWEEAEAARVEAAEKMIADIHIAGIIAPEDTVATVRDRGAMVWQIKLDEALLGDRLDEARSAKNQSVEALKAALARLTKEEEDRAELARLRAEKEAREAREREEIAAREKAEREAEEARIAEERRIAAENAEAERIERVRQQAAEKAQRDAEAAAQAERDRVQREHDAVVAEANRRAAEAERRLQEEAARVAAKVEADRIEAKRIADEQAAREANKAHRTKVKTAAKQAIMTCGASEETAQKIVLAIIAGEIPSVRLEF